MQFNSPVCGSSAVEGGRGWLPAGLSRGGSGAVPVTALSPALPRPPVAPVAPVLDMEGGPPENSLKLG